IGSRYVASHEASSHINFKNAVIQTQEGDTQLTLKELTPVRLIKNDFYKQVQEAYDNNANKETLAKILGRGRAKKGMFEGDLVEGELEIGQISARINSIESAHDITVNIWNEFKALAEKPIYQFN